MRTSHSTRSGHGLGSIALAAGILAAGCIDLGGPVPDGGFEPEPSPDADVPVDGPVVDVRIIGMAFVPKRLEIAPGTTVRWTNEDAVAHTVTEGRRSSPVAPAWSSPYLPGGGVWERYFGDPGSWDYYCIVHSAQGGTVEVR
ncbi:MAG: hypothetical protein HYY06_30130 [Deltaproteobacteria bacterium]|nr:hypothetical protein [Deltaproteobacteria bacterium]